MPAIVEVQVRVALPEPVTLAGVIEPHVSPDGTVSVSETVPANPLIPLTMMFEVSEVPMTAGAGEDAVTVKSTKLNVAMAE